MRHHCPARPCYSLLTALTVHAASVMECSYIKSLYEFNCFKLGSPGVSETTQTPKETLRNLWMWTLDISAVASFECAQAAGLEMWPSGRTLACHGEVQAQAALNSWTNGSKLSCKINGIWGNVNTQWVSDDDDMELFVLLGGLSLGDS